MANLVNTQAVVGEVNIEDETVVAVVEVEQPVSADLTIPTVVSEESEWRNVEVEAVTLPAESEATATFEFIEEGVKFTFGIPEGEPSTVPGPMGSITSVIRTSGTGAAGTTDTYTATCSDGSTFTFTVYNGRDGLGSGDMSKSVYDPQNKNADIFAYADTKYTKPTDGIPMEDLSEEVQSAIEEGGGGGSNPNLLDNGWFTVNQRGFTLVSGGSFGFDRWSTSSTSTMAPISNGAKCSATNGNHLLRQNHLATDLNILGKTVTLTFNTSLGLVVGTFAMPSNLPTSGAISLDGDVVGQVHAQIQLTYNGNFVCALKSTEAVSDVEIYSAKLELGSTSTLALDSAPNYATELLKCQRYFYRYKATNDAHIGYGVISTSVLSRIQLIVPVPMRTTPTVTYNFGSNNFRVRTSNNHLVIASAIRIMAYSGGNDVYVYVDHASLTDSAGTLAMLNVNASNGYIDLSADL